MNLKPTKRKIFLTLVVMFLAYIASSLIFQSIGAYIVCEPDQSECGVCDITPETCDEELIKRCKEPVCKNNTDGDGAKIIYSTLISAALFYFIYSALQRRKNTK